jgi:hypothetical protein
MEALFMPKLEVESALLERAKQAAKVAGYSSVEEFVAHCIEAKLKGMESDQAESQVADQLRGLGYIE